MTCSVTHCERPVYAAGMCSTHYNRKRTTGTTDPGPRARASFEERLWKYIDKRSDDECWPWVGKSKIDGYGVIGVGGRQSRKMLAHRAVWTVLKGPIPKGDGYHGTVVMHVCDNRLCCNPAHLRLGTQADNITDMNDKHRSPFPIVQGEAHRNAVMSEDMAREVLQSAERNCEIARRLGVSRASVGLLRRGVTWRHLTRTPLSV